MLCLKDFHTYFTFVCVCVLHCSLHLFSNLMISIQTMLISMLINDNHQSSLLKGHNQLWEHADLDTSYHSEVHPNMESKFI